MARPVITTKIFIPAKQIDTELLKQHFDVPLYKEDVCKKCPVYRAEERHSDQCDGCTAYEGILQLWSKVKVDGKHYIGLPPGQPARIENIFGVDLSRAEDLRPEIPFKRPIKFIGQLYDGSVIDGRRTVNQQQVTADWWARKTGIINCAPRSGKTVMSIYLACKLGLKTIIVANKKTLLLQFRDTILGSDNRKAVTNAAAPRVKIIEKMSDFENADIVLVNYQKFIRSTAAFARISDYINNYFSLLILDEAHGAGATAFLKFIAKLNCKYRLSLSATPLRKDGKDRLLRLFVGGVVAKSVVVAMPPKIEIVETGVKVKNPYRLWVYAMKHLAQNKNRNILIVKDVFKDLRFGYHSIIIPVDFVSHGELLVKMINRQAEINNIKRGENWPEPTAVFFSASIKKSPEKMQEILNSIDNKTHRVLVAVRSMIKEGVDLSRPEVLYNIIPCSGAKGVGAPLFWQLTSRVSTWHRDKKQPIIRLYIDGMGQSTGCLRSLWFCEILPGLRNTLEKPAHYLMDKKEQLRLEQILKVKDYVPPNKEGERVYSKNVLKTVAAEKVTPRGFSSF